MGLESCGCYDCGLIFINPRPTACEMDKFYSQMYRMLYKSTKKPNDKYITSGTQLLRADFVVANLCKYFDIDSNFKVLDIGCAEGTLLKSIEKCFRHASLFGLEPDHNFAEYARTKTRASVTSGNFEDTIKTLGRNEFDLVTTTHVLEHILDPNIFLRATWNILKPYGLLYVEVPNISHKDTKGLGNIHLGHVLSFSPENLSFLLEKNNYTIIDILLTNLPALTPSMAYICRKAKSDRKTHITKTIIHRTIRKFITDVAASII